MDYLESVRLSASVSTVVIVVLLSFILGLYQGAKIGGVVRLFSNRQ